MKKRYLPYRFVFILILSASILFSTMILVCAHPGGTDSNGGHYDTSTGEYHYHHGYPAHYHENGNCPYGYHDNTEETTSSKKSTNSNKSKSYNSFSINTFFHNIANFLEDALLFLTSSYYILVLAIPILSIPCFFISSLIDGYKSKKKRKYKETYVIPLKEQLDILKQREDTLRKQIAETTSKELENIKAQEIQVKKKLSDANTIFLSAINSDITETHEKEFYESFIKNGSDVKLAGFPEDVEIINGLPVDNQRHWEKYGRFTFYQIGNGAIHFARDCSGASTPYHFVLDKDRLKKSKLCLRCTLYDIFGKHEFYKNSSQWYENYLKIQEIRKKYDNK